MNRGGWPAGRLSAVVFDLDGVLADSLDVMRRAFTAAHAEVVGAGEAPFDEYRTYMGLYFPEFYDAWACRLKWKTHSSE